MNSFVSSSHTKSVTLLNLHAKYISSMLLNPISPYFQDISKKSFDKLVSYEFIIYISYFLANFLEYDIARHAVHPA
jgi:hypothetical protein